MQGRETDASTVERDGVRIGAPGLPGDTAVPAGPATAVDDGVHRELIHRELLELPLPALRRRREKLAAEVRRVRHWARLVRARRDLLVAGAVDLEDLAVPVEAGTHGGPLETLLGVRDLMCVPLQGDLDPGHGLRAVVMVAAPASPPLQDQLCELSAAERRLTAYDAALDAELALATEVFLERCTALFGAPAAARAEGPAAR